MVELIFYFIRYTRKQVYVVSYFESRQLCTTCTVLHCAVYAHGCSLGRNDQTRRFVIIIARVRILWTFAFLLYRSNMNIYTGYQFVYDTTVHVIRNCILFFQMPFRIGFKSVPVYYLKLFFSLCYLYLVIQNLAFEIFDWGIPTYFCIIIILGRIPSV